MKMLRYKSLNSAIAASSCRDFSSSAMRYSIVLPRSAMEIQQLTKGFVETGLTVSDIRVFLQ